MLLMLLMLLMLMMLMGFLGHARGVLADAHDVAWFLVALPGTLQLMPLMRMLLVGFSRAIPTRSVILMMRLGFWGPCQVPWR